MYDNTEKGQFHCEHCGICRLVLQIGNKNAVITFTVSSYYVYILELEEVKISTTVIDVDYV